MRKSIYYGCCFIGCVIGANIGVHLSSGKDYVVTDKAENSIIFSGVNKDTLTRVMQFKDVDYGMEYYKYINVGDTLKLAFVNKGLVYKNYFSCIGINCPRIKKINGKSLGEMRKLAKRDSLVHKIRQSNQRVK